MRNGTIKNWEKGILLQADDTYGVPYTVSGISLTNAPVSHYSHNTTMQMTSIKAVDSRIEGHYGGDVSISKSTLTRSTVNMFEASATITNSTLVQSPIDTSALGQIIIDSSKLDGKGTSALGSVSETGITIKNSIVKNFAEPITGYGVR